MRKIQRRAETENLPLSLICKYLWYEKIYRQKRGKSQETFKNNHSSLTGKAPLKKWTQVAAVWRNDSVDLYVNGAFKNTVAINNAQEVMAGNKRKIKTKTDRF